MKILFAKVLPWKSLSSNASLSNLPLNPSPASTRLFTVTRDHFRNDPSRQSCNTAAYYSHFLAVLAQCKTTHDLKALKSTLIVQGLITPEFLTKDFIRRCYDLGDYDLASSTSKLVGTRPRLLSQNLMLKWFCDDGLFEYVLMYFGKSRISGCPSDNYTIPLVLKACAVLNDVSLGRILHGVIFRNGFFGENVVVQTALVSFYSKIGRIRKARLLFDRMPERDMVAWNALISGCCTSGHDEAVLELFLETVAMGLRPNVSTLASVIPACSRSGFVDVGISLHGLAIKSGTHTDESLIPCLISMYSCKGDLLQAGKIFYSSKNRTIAIWNAMISANTGNQKSARAFELFLEMLRDGLQPNMVTFLSIFPACENIGTLWNGDSLHALVIKFGLANQHSVATALMSMYAKVGDIESAEHVFDRMLQRNLLSWNSMVSAYVSNGLWDASFNTFREMQLAGVDPDAISVISILSSCSEVDDFPMGKSVYSFIVKKGIDSNLNVCNSLLAFFSGFGKLDSAFVIFDRMSKPNIVSWNTMLSGCLHAGKTESAFILFHRMQQEDVGFDLVTLKSLLPACCKGSGDLMLGVAIHGYAIKTGFDRDVSFTNALISMYMNCGDLESGTFLFENMPSRNVISWNVLLSGYRHLNAPCDIAVLVRLMTEEKQKPNYITLLSLLQSCNTLFQGKAIHSYAVRTGFMKETPLLTSLMLMYARFGNGKSCQYIFRMGHEGNLSMWNAVISAHLKLNDPGSAFSIFIDLLRKGDIETDFVTFLSVISVCVQINNLIFNDSIFAYLIRKGFDQYIAINNALIDLYAKCGNISTARKLFELLPEKDSISWSAMMNGYGLHGDGEAALSLLSQMRLSGMKPDGVAYLNILSACSHSGLVEQGRTVFQSMIDDGIGPRREHYACFIDLLGRTGYLDEAYDILKSLPCKFVEDLLDSLLGACLTHGNIQLGEELGKLVPGMKSIHSGLYVILHNIYAAAGRWTEANRLRFEMEEKELTKVAGISIVEGNGS